MRGSLGSGGAASPSVLAETTRSPIVTSLRIMLRFELYGSENTWIDCKVISGQLRHGVYIYMHA